MYEINEMLLRRKNKVNLPKCSVKHEAGRAEKAMVVSIVKNVESLGFTFDKELFENLLTYPKNEIEMFYTDFIAKLKPLVGADKEYNPMYPNFPRQVVEASDAELFINAILYYWTFGEWMPEYEKDERMPLFDETKLTILTVGNTNDILDIFKNLVSSKTNLSTQDKADIEEIIATYSNFYDYLPDEIPLKENVALIGKLILNKVAIKNATAIQKYYKTATDILRLVTALSDGDISLATDTKYRSLRRCERRMVMDLLAGCGNILEDMYRYQYQWIRIGEIIHPFEFTAKRYKSVNNAFNNLRNGKKPLFVPGRVQAAINVKDMQTAAILLKDRPGDFARQLDKLLRDASNKNYVVNCFREVADKVSVPVLLQVRQHFKDRNNGNPIRVFFPKGNLARAISIPNELPAVDDKICKAVVKICDNAIIEQFKSKDFMGNVYIDESMRNFLVPFNQRSASTGSKSLVRGSRVGLNENAEAVRAFIWWTNSNGRVDIDLSAAIYDENWNYVEHISYTRLRSGKMKAYHSGDITNGGNVNGKGVAEFIDINVDAVAQSGRYVAFQVYSYTGQKFSELPNCRFGWMEREDVNSGEIFEPSTVDMSIDVNAEGVTAIPVIFDCKTKEFIWCDMNLAMSQNRYSCWGNNLESNMRGVTAVCYAMTHLSKPNLYSLIVFNAMARGMMVDNRNDADIIFSNDTTPPVEIVEVEDEKTGKVKLVERVKSDVQIITAYDTDYIMGQLL